MDNFRNVRFFKQIECAADSRDVKIDFHGTEIYFSVEFTYYIVKFPRRPQARVSDRGLQEFGPWKAPIRAYKPCVRKLANPVESSTGIVVKRHIASNGVISTSSPISYSP